MPEWTAEGLERNFVLNYLSRYLLARQLLPALTRRRSGRLVLVSNAGMYGDSLDFDDLQHRRGKPGLKVAARTQFANDLLATELAARLRDTRVEVTCVYPGVVNTGVFRNARGLPWIVRVLAPKLQRLMAMSPEAAAQTPVFLAQHDRAVGTGGQLFRPPAHAASGPGARATAGATQPAVGGERRPRAAVPDGGRTRQPAAGRACAAHRSPAARRVARASRASRGRDRPAGSLAFSEAPLRECCCSRRRSWRKPAMEFITSPAAKAAKLPFSQAVRVGDVLYLSGSLGNIPGTRQLVPGGMEAQARQTMDNIGAVLKENGLSFADIFKCTVMLADMSKWDDFNKIYVTYFNPDRLPARSAFGTNGLALGAEVELECLAYAGRK